MVRRLIYREYGKQKSAPGLKVSLVLIMLGLSLLACTRQQAGRAISSTEVQSGGRAVTVAGSIDHQGVARSYTILLPRTYSPEVHIPLILALHGGGGNAQAMCALKAGIQQLADQERFMVVCPQGVEDHWNDGRLAVGYRAHQEGIDDVGFLLALIDQMAADYSIDKDRVFVTGYSNGGMMTYRLACEQPEAVAAIAAGIANLPADLDCQPSQPIAVMILNGTADPLMPYQGGQVGTRRNPLGQVLSTEATAEFWAENNGCLTDPESHRLPSVRPDDPTRITKSTYADCQSGAQVVLYTVEAGGHTWPGGPQYAPKFIIGPVSRQANAAELIWAFFNANSK